MSESEREALREALERIEKAAEVAASEPFDGRYHDGYRVATDVALTHIRAALSPGPEPVADDVLRAAARTFVAMLDGVKVTNRETLDLIAAVEADGGPRRMPADLLVRGQEPTETPPLDVYRLARAMESAWPNMDLTQYDAPALAHEYAALGEKP